MTDPRPAVLIVDDQPNWRSLFSDLLEDEYQVVSVGSYTEALGALDRDPPFRVAVVDIRLNDRDRRNEDGLRLIEEIKREGKPTKTIVVTGYPTFRTSRRAFRDLEVFDYIEKYPEDGSGFDSTAFRDAVGDAIKLSKDDPTQDRPAEEATSVGQDEPRQRGTLSKAVEAIVRPISSKRWKRSQVVCATWAR